MKKLPSQALLGEARWSPSIHRLPETQVPKAPLSIMGLFYFISRDIMSISFILGTFADDILVAIKSEK